MKYAQDGWLNFDNPVQTEFLESRQMDVDQSISVDSDILQVQYVLCMGTYKTVIQVVSDVKNTCPIQTLFIDNYCFEET